MVSALVLDSVTSSPSLDRRQGTASCSWERHFTLVLVSLSNQVHKQDPANLTLGGATLVWCVLTRVVTRRASTVHVLYQGVLKLYSTIMHT